MAETSGRAARNLPDMRIGGCENLTVQLIREDLFGGGRAELAPAVAAKLVGADPVYISPDVIVVQEPCQSCEAELRDAHSQPGGHVGEAGFPEPGDSSGSISGGGGGPDNGQPLDQTSLGGTPPDTGPGGMIDVFA